MEEAERRILLTEPMFMCSSQERKKVMLHFKTGWIP